MLKRNQSKTRSPLKGKPARLPAQSLREEILRVESDEWDNTTMFILLNWTVTAVLAYIYFTDAPVWMLLLPFTCYSVGLTIYGIYKLSRTKAKLKKLRQGRDGELMVAHHLDAVREQGCYVFHDFLADGFNIDHIVVGSQGVLAIETKTMSKPVGKNLKLNYDGDTLKVGDHVLKGDPLKQAKAQADYLKRYLRETLNEDIFVRPVLAYPGWFIAARVRNPHVWVLEPKAIPAYLANEPQRLDSSTVALIKKAITMHTLEK